MAVSTSVVLIKPSGYFQKLIHGPYKEALLKVGISKNGGMEVPCLFGMCDKGFGFVLDHSQFKGDITYQHIKSETIKIHKEINSHRFWKAVGRTKIEGVTLDSWKALAYILELDGWRTATYKTLFKIEND